MLASLRGTGKTKALNGTDQHGKNLTSCAADPEAYLQRWRSRNSVIRWNVLGRPCKYMLYQVRQAPGVPRLVMQAVCLLLQLDNLQTTICPAAY